MREKDIVSEIERNKERERDRERKRERDRERKSERDRERKRERKKHIFSCEYSSILLGIRQQARVTNKKSKKNLKKLMLCCANLKKGRER